MNKIRKLFRGSGRALAFIFVASVIWLIFDMAALKLSFSEINTRVLKDEMIRRERERFRVWRNLEKTPESSRREPRPPPKGFERGRFSKEKYRNIEEKVVEAENEIDKQNEKGIPKPTEKRSMAYKKMIVPLGTFSVKLLSPYPSVPMEKKERKKHVKAVNSTDLLGTKQTVPKRLQQNPLAAATGRSVVKLTHSTATVRNKVAQKENQPVTKASKGIERNLKIGITEKILLAGLKQELQIEANPKEPQNKPPVADLPIPGQIILVKQNRIGVKAINGTEHKANRSLDVPVSKLAAANSAEKKGLSTKTTGPGKLPKEDKTKAAHEKKLTFSENQFVIISKEGIKINVPETQNLVADSKGNFTMSLKMRKEQQFISNKSEDAPNMNSVTKTAELNGLTKKAILTEGPELTKVHSVRLDDKEQLRKRNRSSYTVHFTRDTGMHKVLTIDVTLSPRNPKAPGQFGRPAAVPDDKQEEAKSRWKEGNFNVYLSDLIPVDRAIDDTRPDRCSEQLVHNDLPTTTIIMCFVDEVWSTLLRSVHSVLNRSPPHLIKEIILVDDFSTKEYLKGSLDKYMSQFPKVRLLHLKERHGLIRARLAGAEIAKGDVLTFLDSHVECNVGWLEPLLERVRLNRKKVVCPVIEVISDKDMSYMTVDNFQRGIFTWPMNFGWRQIPPEVIEKDKIKETDIIRCPVMAGGLFSIDKKYFFELGTYDPGLDVWGGENMELSFKVWMCGGEIEIIPCSRVGHIFRNDNPYSFPKDRIKTVERNLARVAEVWLDEYKELFYGHGYHLIQKNLDVGDLTQQIELRKKLKCKNFKWYLENIYPDLEAPLVKASGLIVNIAMARCITVENSTLAFEACNISNKNQKFNYTWLRLIKHGDVCIAPVDAKRTLGLYPCDNRNNSLKWLHKSLVAFQPELMDHMVLEHLQQPTCLEVDQSHKILRVNACDASNPYQKWQFGNYYAD
ncbi:polypeptide N-acetylgalactosaminyltransferase 5 [Chelonoidis abingdonii]|uniref:polypeptide N-acetylgalactosaminyltransferase 5 n=1 Tax=Chelonoidis abingdonii TaxID=106734 RepID=UPI0013F1E9EF|nr:polypeptide N-acetylgalactosaminyltransferase 5 [Chelonoidis abingdonii]XP_032645041.1 polypeptide N-acetylgalactosaminyltransferase 5 [Chelonoidis abingdonii]